jgi:hypothetical protein
MLNGKPVRHTLAALGSVALLAGAGTTSAALAAEFRAALTGANEVPPGDPDGSGVAEITVDDTLNRLCVQIEVGGISPATAAHIHRGAAGENGPPVVTLDAPDAGDEDEDDCDLIGDALADDIQRNPAGFYVNIHTADFPNGAIRGQLTPSAE